MSVDDGFGFDKAARLRAEREKAAEVARDERPRLEPEFPYVAIPFDPLFFGEGEEG
ncbi:MAG: hypothetical protein QM496_01890 [Verrucomicrobiota bacterium]